MSQELTKNAQNIKNILIKEGLECKVIEFSTSTKTANDAAMSIGCDVSQIVKSLIFKTKETEKPVLVLVSGSNKVDEKRIESYVHEGITKADADFTRDMTGFSIGGIPPIAHKTRLDLIFIDQDLMLLDEVWAAAGTPNAVFCISSNDLLRITNGKVISIWN